MLSDELEADQAVIMVVVTHFDWDHCADLMQLVRTHSPRHVKVNNDTAWRQDTDHPKLRALIRGLADWDDEAPSTRWGAATVETISNEPAVGRFSWRVLAPRQSSIGRAHAASDRNLASVVFRLEDQGRIFLWLGDAPGSTLTRLAAGDPASLSADVVVATHHGGNWRSSASEISGQDFYGLVEAEIAIVSTGHGNNYGHPLPEHVQDVIHSGARVMCTQVTARCLGAATLEGAHAAAQAATGRVSSGSHCAATVVVGIDDGGTLVYNPAAAAHDARIDLWHAPCCRASANLVVGDEACSRADAD